MNAWRLDMTLARGSAPNAMLHSEQMTSTASTSPNLEWTSWWTENNRWEKKGWKWSWSTGLPCCGILKCSKRPLLPICDRWCEWPNRQWQNGNSCEAVMVYSTHAVLLHCRGIHWGFFFSLTFFCFILAFLNLHEKKTVSAQISKYHKRHNPTEYDRFLKFTETVLFWQLWPYPFESYSNSIQ